MSSNDSQRCYFLTFNTSKIDQVKVIYTFVATLDAILILPTIVLNVLLIVSLYRSSEIRKPTTKLLFSLALSDVLVGLVIEPAYFTKKIAEINHNFTNYCITGMVTYVAGGVLATVSFFTLTAIAIDRYLVIHTGTKYRTIVTNPRVKLTVLMIWASALILLTAQLYISRMAYFQISAGIAISCVLLASLFYVKCFLTLRKYKHMTGSLHENAKCATDRQFTGACNYQKSMHTMAYVFLVFNACYLPFICTAISAVILGESSAIWGAESIATMFIYGNSCINPVILILRMKEIRRAVATTMSVDLNHNMNQNKLKDDGCQRARDDLNHHDVHSYQLQARANDRHDASNFHLEELHFDVKGINTSNHIDQAPLPFLVNEKHEGNSKDV